MNYGLHRIPESINIFVVELLLLIEEETRQRQGEAEVVAGYGTNFENEIFSMHLFWWGEEESPEAKKPNFLYKPIGLQIYWRKRIGEGMLVNDTAFSKKQMLAATLRCLQSLNNKESVGT